MKKLMIIDGNSILNRAYYGIRMLTAPDGTPTNAVYGFLNILFKNLDEDMPDYLCVAFDVKEKTFRHKMYDLYKAQRKPAPEDFLVQLPLMKEVLGAMNCVCLEKPGYEADDTIGTVSAICENEGIECLILTGDKDDLQLASELVKVKLVISRMGSTTTTVYDSAAVVEKYSVTPDEFIDVKALMGDASDNIPGVKGIGEKTAFSLIEQYKGIDKIYEQIESIDVTPSVRKKLEEGRDLAYLSRQLATIDRNVPMDFELEKCGRKEVNEEELAKLFTRLNFKSFLNRMNLKETAAAETVSFEGKCEAVDGDKAIELVKKSKTLAYRLYTEKECAMTFTADGEHFFRLENPDGELLREFFESKSCGKVGFDVKNDILYLKSIGIEYNALIFDIAIGAYILDPTRSAYDLEGLALEFLGMAMGGKSEDNENGQLSLNFDDDMNDDEGAEELYIIYQLWKTFSEKIEENGQHRLYYDVELPLIEVLADMQHRGVYVDKAALEDFGSSLKEQIKGLEKSIYNLAGREFNINLDLRVW